MAKTLINRLTLSIKDVKNDTLENARKLKKTFLHLSLKNDLVFFLDGDDLFFREHIFLCLHSFITNPELHFVQTGIRYR